MSGGKKIHSSFQTGPETSNKNRVCVVANLKDHSSEIDFPFEIKKVLLSNYDKEYCSNRLFLEPYETLVVEIK